jgi:hypothetical protein
LILWVRPIFNKKQIHQYNLLNNMKKLGL